jgi:polyphosphate kinase
VTTKDDRKAAETGTPDSYVSRDLSWLDFARRVLALAEDPEVPLLERVRFVGIMGMLHDEFFMKRMSGLKREAARGSTKRLMGGRLPREELEACRKELAAQGELLNRVIADILPRLEREGIPILDHEELGAEPRAALRTYFEDSILPVLTPLAVDSEHPFPFVSNLALNVVLTLRHERKKRARLVRVKVPSNLPRWVPVPGGSAFTPLEQVIAANLGLLYEAATAEDAHFFRVTRGADGDPDRTLADRYTSLDAPGSIIEQVSYELKARKFAGVVRLEVSDAMPTRLREGLSRQLGIGPSDVYPSDRFLGLGDLSQFQGPQGGRLRFARHAPVVHPRLRGIPPERPQAIFEEIARGDILLHHPYHDFSSSVLRFLQAAARDPMVLAIKLTIYRTSKDSPIVLALAEAARRGKQVVVQVEVTARFDEAPNIAWGKFLEEEGAHVVYGVDQLKTHVKLALVIRQEGTRVRRYAHVGTGNYHPGTAKIYEDLGLMTSDPEVCRDVASVFNALTGATGYGRQRRVLVAPVTMRRRFVELIRREASHAREGRPSGICAKMNQLQDPDIIQELYEASRAGVRVDLVVRGLCCLRAGVPGLSENVRVISVVGRFLEHSRIYRFANGGDPEYFMGSADWMKRNLSNRVETVVPVRDEKLRRELDDILGVYLSDNASAWDAGPDGAYTRRRPREGEERRAVQEVFIRRATEDAGGSAPPPPPAVPPPSRPR